MASSNTLITPTIIAKEALMMLENNMVMGNLVHRQYKQEFAKIGTSVTIRKPNKFTATKAQARTNTNMAESSDTLTVATQAHVSWAFSSVELTMTIEEYSRRYIKPAANALANIIDKDGCALYTDVWNTLGTPGVHPSTFKSLGDCQQRLDEEAAPADQRVAVLNPAANWNLADGLKGTFAAKPALDIFTKGYLGTVAGLDLHMDQNIQAHTTGTFTTSSTPLVNGSTSQGATTLVTDGWQASTAVLKDGDVFTVANVYSVNPVSGDSTGVLKQYSTTSDKSSDASGDATISVPFAQRSTGAYKTISAMPANDAAITPLGTEATAYAQNLVFHPNAFALVVMPLAMPAGVWGGRETFNNMSIRVVKDYDIDADEEIIRLDVLYGWKAIYPELATRLAGA